MGNKQSTSYDDVEALCPFFRKSDKYSITCEGVEDDSINKTVFRDETGREHQESRNNYRAHYCNLNYSKCRIYRMLNEKY